MFVSKGDDKVKVKTQLDKVKRCMWSSYSYSFSLSSYTATVTKDVPSYFSSF